MKKTITYAFAFLLCICSCDRAPVEPIQPEQPEPHNNSEISEFNQFLRGVWEMDEDNIKGLFFIAFSPTSDNEGKFSLCFSTEIMSSGTYKIQSTGASSRVTLKNYAGSNCGYLNIGSYQEGHLVLYGSVNSYGKQSSDDVYGNFTKTNQPIAFPVVGQIYSYQGLGIYGSFHEYVQLTSNYKLHHYCQQTNGTIYQDYYLYYVFRKKNNSSDPLVYTTDIYGDGYIRIYQLEEDSFNSFSNTEIQP